jgi:hypothetical protein
VAEYSVKVKIKEKGQPAVTHNTFATGRTLVAAFNKLAKDVARVVTQHPDATKVDISVTAVKA